MPKIDDACLNALRPKPKPPENPPEAIRTPSDDGIDSMEVDKVPTGRTLKKRKEKLAKHLKRGANEKEKESFQKRVFRIPLEKPFDEAYYTHRLWMFFRETREIEEDIRKMFCEAREQMRKRVTLKKSDPGQFAIPCTVKGIEFPHALCDTGASVSILPRVMAYNLYLRHDTGLWIPAGRGPGSQDSHWKGPRFSGSPLGGTLVPCYEVLWVRSPGPPPSPGKKKTFDKENLSYFRIWKSLTYSNRLRPALRSLYKGNLNPKARDRHFETFRLELGS
ncbi:hypothetical protein F2Q70_00003778 [Brassica cretica]|uniref:Uncharacterized protein n=1 Tax=Brassica cretica TaxID=69181 RepID=A0A8S9IWX5_BRACR|nr:hypothetical protein F2Q70_00003778 [Brassica cretica]KAF3595697.1 hypothetical protein DY000_02020417 [Brassica cretica]